MTALAGQETGTVDGSLDKTLVDFVVNELARLHRSLTGGVYHLVEHVLVEPVGTLGDRALDGGDDDVVVEMVE